LTALPNLTRVANSFTSASTSMRIFRITMLPWCDVAEMGSANSLLVSSLCSDYNLMKGSAQ